MKGKKAKGTGKLVVQIIGWGNLHLQIGAICGEERQGGVSICIDDKAGGVIRRADAAAIRAFLEQCEREWASE